MNFDLKKLAPWNWFKKEQETHSGGSQLPVFKTSSALPSSSPLSLHSFDELHRQIDRLVFDALRGFGFSAPAFPPDFPALFRPSLDIEETNTEYRITLELPGVEEKDIQLLLDESVLYVRGQKQREENRSLGSYHCIERSYGSFQRSLNLPHDVDENAIRASFKNGVLTVTLGKREVREKPTARTIPIGP